MRNARLRLEGLTKKGDDYKAQIDFIRKNGFHPYGPDAEPLTPDEFESLKALRRMFDLPPIRAADTQPAPLPAIMTPPPVVEMSTVGGPTTRPANEQGPPVASQPTAAP